jgi:hypothetical protein
MDAHTLVQMFETGVAPPEGFHHRQHVQAAWHYLRHHPLPDALQRFSTALRRFAEAQGKPGLYHETITVAYVLLINERLDGAGRELDWTTFADLNADLICRQPPVLDRYYEKETLASDRARRTFVFPDRRPSTSL